jgi:hypothetical protein
MRKRPGTLSTRLAESNEAPPTTALKAFSISSSDAEHARESYPSFKLWMLYSSAASRASTIWEL